MYVYAYFFHMYMHISENKSVLEVESIKKKNHKS